MDKKVYVEWVHKADEDYDFANISLSLKEYEGFYSQICFHYQQSAEKYLKAYILSKDLPFKKIHDLKKIAKICVEKDKEFETIFIETGRLTNYYIESRYPLFIKQDINKKDAEQAREYAKKIRELVLKKI